MKKGFTLVELLGVIVILAVISMIAVPLIDRSINEGDEDLYNTQMNQILKAAKNYYAENLEKLNSVGGGCDEECISDCCVTLETLQEDGYLPTEVDNPKTGETFKPNEIVVLVTKNGQHFEYKVVDKSEENGSEN